MPRDIRSIDDLTPDARNANLGTERGRYMLEQSIREVGAGRSIVVDAEGRVIAGNKTLEVAEALGLPIEVVRTDGTRLVVVQRDDLDLANGDDKARRLAYFDNRSGQVGLEWDAAQMVADLELGLNLDDMFKDFEVVEIVGGVPFGDTSTDRDGQDVASPWYKYKTDPDRQYIIIGEMEVPISGEILERLRQTLEVRFLDGIAYKETLETIITQGIDAVERSAG